MRDRGLLKTRQFDDEKYVGDPINAVKIFNEKEVDELMIFDIGASSRNKGPDMEHLRSIAIESRMPLCYGGGVTNADQAAQIIELGYEKVSLSSAAIDRPGLVDEVVSRIGGQSVVVTIDTKKTGLTRQYAVFTMNGKRRSRLSLFPCLEDLASRGIGEILINSIQHDGMLNGYDLDLARMVRSRVSIPLTMLGGAGTVTHMEELIGAVGIVGAAAGSMFVFRGAYRAVLINYARPNGLDRVWSSDKTEFTKQE